MATRFYLPSTGAAPISPAFAAEWNHTTGTLGNADRLAAVTTKIASAMATKNARSPDVGSLVNEDTLFRQYVYGPIAAVNFNGTTIKGRVLARELDAAANLRSQFLVRIIQSDGTTVRATVYAGDLATLTGNPTSEWATALTNRQMPRGASVNCANVAALDGDYLVLELGFRQHAASGRIGQLRFGDSNGTDLPENETTTTDNDPWIEFSATISPESAGPVEKFAEDAQALATTATAALAAETTATDAASLSAAASATLAAQTTVSDAQALAATASAELTDAATAATDSQALAAVAAITVDTGVQLKTAEDSQAVAAIETVTLAAETNATDVQALAATPTASAIETLAVTATDSQALLAPGSGDLWTPDVYTDGADLVRWFDPAQNAVLTDNTVLTQLDDASPNADPITATSNAGSAPTIETNEINGHPIVRFTGNNYLDTEGSVDVTGDRFTFIHVWKRLNATGAGGADAKDDFWTARPPTDSALSTHGWNQFTLKSYDGIGTYAHDPTNGDFVYYGNEDDGGWHVRVEIFDGTNTTGRLDGAASVDDPDFTTENYDFTGASIAQGFTIAFDLALPQFSAKGDLAHFAVHGRALPLVEVERWEGWLAHRFGIPLASGHPYEDAPPTIQVVSVVAETVAVDAQSLDATADVTFAAAVAISDAAALDATATAILTDAATTASDAQALTVAETVDLFAAVTATDSQALAVIATASAEEQGVETEPKLVTDAQALTAAESLTVAQTAADSQALTATADATLSAETTAADAQALAVSETVDLAASVTVADAQALAAAASVDVAVDVVDQIVSDSQALSVTASVSVRVFVEVADTQPIATTEMIALAASVTLTDTVALAATNTLGIGATIAIQDSAILAAVASATAQDVTEAPEPFIVVTAPASSRLVAAAGRPTLIAVGGGDTPLSPMTIGIPKAPG